jgi:uncharacterized protein (TIGR02217 family)
MSYIDAPFPERIAFGAESVPEWSTSIAENAGGYQFANQNWRYAQHTFDVSLSVRVATDYRLVRAHFHQVRGRAYTFGFKDFLDFEASTSEGVLELVTGAIYQMGKRYAGANPYDRKITRPVAATLAFFRTRASVTTSISPTVDATTGRVTVAGHMDGDTYAWSGQFLVPVRYSSDRLPGAVVNKEPGSGGELYVQVDSIVLAEDRE